MISGIPGPTGSNIQRTIFYGSSATEGGNWQTYSVPSNVSMLSILLLGGGGGGGNGFAGAEDSAGGGGGGGSAAQTCVMLPAAFLPSTLYLSIGLGGIPLLRSGVPSRISAYPDLVANTCIIRAGGGGTGSTGTAANGGNGGTAGSATSATAANMPLGYAGLVIARAGIAGSSGGISGNGQAYTPTTVGIVNGGSGGGGSQRAGDPGRNGGTYNTIASGLFFPIQPTGQGGAASAAGGNGSNGFMVNKNLLYTYGGSGGGSGGGTSGAGGNGGTGGYGSGGGGGGGSRTGNAIGIGGDGGPGLAVIYAW